MEDKEKIIIDGKKYNKCEGCELYDGYMCNGARSYEPEGEAHSAICDKHIAQEFWKVYNQLARKTQECERSRKRISDLEERIINHSNEIEEYCSRLADKNKKCEKYEQALEEIKEIAEQFCNACQEFEPEKKGSNCMYCNYGKILQKISECEVNND